MLQKIIVTSDRLTFPPGSRLGLGSNIIDFCRSYVKKIEGCEHQYEVVVPLTLKRNCVLWADHLDCKRATGEYTVSPMPRGYLEESPEDIARREKFLAKQKEDAQSIAAQREISRLNAEMK